MSAQSSSNATSDHRKT